MKKRTLLALAWGGCTAVLLTPACSPEATDAQVEQEVPEIRVVHIVRQEVTDTKEWFGYLAGRNITDIHPRVTGFLVEQCYTNGSFVKAGDVLFRIDSSTFEAELAQAQANLQAAEATLASNIATRDQAQLDVERFSQLFENNAASQKDLDSARQRLHAAEASVRSAQAVVDQQRAAVHKAQIDVDYCVIRAPYDGVAGTSLVSIGDLVSPATKMSNISAVDPILAKFAVSSESLMAYLRKYPDLEEAADSHRNGPGSVELVLEDGSVYPEKGHIVTVGSSVSENGMVDMEAQFDNPGNMLRDGMPVRVRIAVSKREALLVPPAAVRSVLRNNFIIVVDTENVPHTIPVNLGGEYEVMTPAGPAKMVAIEPYNQPLAEVLRGFGYSKPTDAIVVADPANGVRAMNISARNSRLAEGEPKGVVKPVSASNTPEIPAALAAAAERAAKGQKEEENPDAQPTLPPVPVKAAPLLQQDVAVTDEWFGTLRGVQETDIRPQVTGFLISRNFENGARVKKGDILYEIDPAPFQAALEEAEANLQAARAAKEQAESLLELNRADLDRYENLHAKDPGAISEKTLSDARTAVATSEAAVRKAEANIAQMQALVDLAKINLEHTVIRAPYDGRVGISTPSIGALVSPTDPLPMVRLSSVDPIRVDFNVSGRGALKGIAEFSALLQAGSDCVGPEFQIVMEDGTIYPAMGRVVSADNAVSRSTGTMQIVGQVDNVDGVLRSGMPVRVRAGMDVQKGSYLVPARAPFNAQGMDMLVVLRPDNCPELLPITLGPIVNIPVAGPDGKPVVQPMQIIDVDRHLFGELVRYAANNAPSLEAVILGQAGVEDWGALLLKQSGASSFRELMEKQAGHPLPDDAPAQAGVEDWGALLLKQAGAANFREFILTQAGAKDELDLIAQAQGFPDAMHMALAQFGITDLNANCVVVEGSLMAAQIYAANTKAGAHVNKVTPAPFVYTQPQPVVESVTARPSITPPPPADAPGTPEAEPATRQEEQH